MTSGLELEMLLGMVTDRVSDMEMALGIPSERKFIDWATVFRGEPQCFIRSSSPLFTVLFETDMIAVLEEY
jgi:hypothetical protein